MVTEFRDARHGTAIITLEPGIFCLTAVARAMLATSFILLSALS